MDVQAGQTWVERNSGVRHTVEKVTAFFVFHRRDGGRVERTRIRNFLSHCRLVSEGGS